MSTPTNGPPDLDDVDSTVADPEDAELRYLFVVDTDDAAAILPMACDLAADADAELLIGAPVIVPDQTPLTAPEPRLEGERLAAKYVLKAKQQCPEGHPLESLVVTGHGRGDVIDTMVDRYSISLLITGDQPGSGVRGRLGLGTLDQELSFGEADSVLVTRIEHGQSIESILVPVARGPHSGLAIETGLALARQNEASIELFHVYSPTNAEDFPSGEEVLKSGIERLDGYERAERTLLEADDIHDAIVEYAEPFDVTILGSPREGRLRQFFLGTIPEEVAKETSGTVLLAHRGGTDQSWLNRWV